MENNHNSIEKEKKNSFLSKEHEEIIKNIKTKFSELKLNNLFTLQNIISIIIIPFLIYSFYYILLKKINRRN